MKEDYQEAVKKVALFFLLNPVPFNRQDSGKCGKEGKNLQKFEYLENEKSFLDETFFIVFEGLLFDEKIKIW